MIIIGDHHRLGLRFYFITAAVFNDVLKEDALGPDAGDPHANPNLLVQSNGSTEGDMHICYNQAKLEEGFSIKQAQLNKIIVAGLFQVGVKF